MKIHLGLFILTIFSGIAFAGDKNLPDGTIAFPDQSPFGVQAHSHHNGKALKALGVHWVRMEIAWNGVERTTRETWDFSQYDSVVEDYLANGLKILGVLSFHYGNPLYPEPQKDFDAVVKGYTGYAQACATHYKGKVDVWELGNEPDISSVNGWYSQPENYTKIAISAANAIRQVDPTVRIGALSTGWMDRGFIAKCLELGLLKDGNINAVTFHGYHRPNIFPESGLKEDMNWLRSMIRRNVRPGKDVIVVDSERGYFLADFLAPQSWEAWRNRAYCESEQAAYLARHYLEEMSLGIEITVWYKDMAGENGYSLYEVGENSRIRPMGIVYRNMAALFDTNPKQMVNKTYPVTLVDLPDQIPDPNAGVHVRTYLRTYLKNQTLIIALWNPVEAFDGKILQSRQQIGDNFYEAWRAISPEDLVDIPVQVRIGKLPVDGKVQAYQYNLAANEEASRRTPMKLNREGTIGTTETFKVGPMPTIIVVELQK